MTKSPCIKSLLSHPWIYIASQYLFGRGKGTPSMVRDFIRPKAGDKVLDIGCGPAEIIEYLPDVEYWGFDIDPNYIASAQNKYGGKKRMFACKTVTLADLGSLPQFDIVLAIGVLHHVGDEDARQLLSLAYQALRPGGRLITCDPCFETGQNPIARWFISCDRGRNVRDLKGYARLVSAVFVDHILEIRHQTWLPYTLCFSECSRL